MGRRSLPKLDPAIDISRHFRDLKELAPPFDAALHFGRAAPLEVDVGSGKGLFLASASGAFPDRDFVGVELARKYARFAAAKLARSARQNALMINGDGLRFFREFLRDESVSAVHVYFPDPWWKARHKKRRVMNEGLLRDVQRVLLPNGTLHFWTDVEEYFQTSLALIAEVTSLAGPFEVPELAPTHDLDFRTHFERRMRLHDQPIYRAEFRKSGSQPAIIPS